MLAHKQKVWFSTYNLINGEGVSLMHGEFDSYESIKKWKDEHIHQFEFDTKRLNNFHDEMMRSASKLALFHLEKSYGLPPCEFSWFVMGSGGRVEQGIISDQDHGLIYKDHSKKASDYFEKLGEELSRGLHHIGYPYCEGKIMSSNPLWCKSIVDWKQQLFKWMEEKSWESIRYLQIFYDSRSLIGESEYVDELKQFVFSYQAQNHQLLQRFLDNIQHIKQSVGPLGQIYVEPSGKYEGCIDMKKAAFLPYVNAIRLLAIKEGLVETSTLKRIDILCENDAYSKELPPYKHNFEMLLEYRLLLFANAKSYDDVHYLNIRNLTKYERREIKNILKGGKKLHQYVQGIIEKGCL
jgi:CBS domain-containing protein